ncbi:F-box domain containing protein [Trema orientale]|uniref:F-box domain containing protein n=1 Tax=Trema orientale TaxID=63057 RepID=A0A2P5AIU8_TREOI|nr:F-box domain containing protein [Trema orientale]
MLERALRVRRKKGKSERRRSLERCTSSRYIPDDLLHEIMIRLPNLASAVRCSSVCKRWRSITSRSDFTATFMDHIHRSEPKRSLRLLFGGIADKEFSIRVVDNGMMMQSLSPPPPPVAAASAVDSFPCLFKNNLSMTGDSSSSSTTLLGMCEDLLLIKKSKTYYVCNPLTGQLSMLPDPPTLGGGLAGCGVAVEAATNNNKQLVGSGSSSNTRFRVMLMFFPLYRSRNQMASGRTLFCSETWQWTKVITNPAIYSSIYYEDLVASNGLFYWLHVGAKLLISYDPFKDFGDVKAWKSFRLPHIFLPDDFDLLQYYTSHLRLGLFQGRPRLSQLFWDDPQYLSLKVWDLMDNNNIDANAEPSPLTLVHQTLIDAAAATAAAAAAASVSLMSVSVPAFHPIHHNQIFMRFDSYLYQYDLDTKKQVMVAEIENNSGRWDDLRVFPFVYPASPTII